MTPKISIIIPTKNEEINIGRCLKSIVENGIPGYEIIVVDQQSSDKTPEIVRKFGAKFITAKSTGSYIPPSQSRNIGFKHSSGEYIYHVDADMQLERGLLDEIIKIFSDHSVSAIVVPEVDIPGNFFAEGKALERSFYKGTVMEAARVSRREVFEKIGYENGITSGEDWNIHKRFMEYGSISRSKKVVYHHIGKISLFREVRKKINYGSGAKTFVSRNLVFLLKLFAILLYLYCIGIAKNIFIRPLAVLAFILLRIADAFSLIWGIIFRSR